MRLWVSLGSNSQSYSSCEMLRSSGAWSWRSPPSKTKQVLQAEKLNISVFYNKLFQMEQNTAEDSEGCPHHPQSKTSQHFLSLRAVHWAAWDAYISRSLLGKNLGGCIHQKTSSGGLWSPDVYQLGLWTEYYICSLTGSIFVSLQPMALCRKKKKCSTPKQVETWLDQENGGVKLQDHALQPLNYEGPWSGCRGNSGEWDCQIRENTDCGKEKIEEIIWED